MNEKEIGANPPEDNLHSMRDAYDEAYYTKEAEDKAKATCHIIASSEGSHFRVRVVQDAKVLYDLTTGIESSYLAFLAEMYLIPLRDLLEGLGFEVVERYEQ
jgi:hypothetical protein